MTRTFTIKYNLSFIDDMLCFMVIVHVVYFPVQFVFDAILKVKLFLESSDRNLYNVAFVYLFIASVKD